MTTQMLTGPEALDPSRKIDFIVAYPHSSNIRIDDETGQLDPFLSKLTQASMHAGIIALRSHPGAKLVIPGETLYGDDLPNTTDLMVDMAKFAAVSEDDLVPLHSLPDGRGLNNTYMQTERVTQFFGGNQYNMLGVTLGYHMARVQRTLAAYDLSAEVATAEDILHAKEVFRYDKYLDLSRQFITGLGKTEALAWLMTVGNRKGNLPNFLMERTGPRMVDVVEDEGGTLKLENDFAQRRQAQLTRQLGAVAQTRTA